MYFGAGCSSACNRADIDSINHALKKAGYDLACYSYENVSYSDSEVDYIAADLQQWEEEVVPILGDVDIFVYPYGDDIYESMTENNEFMNNVYNNATQLKIVGIACPQGNSAMCRYCRE